MFHKRVTNKHLLKRKGQKSEIVELVMLNDAFNLLIYLLIRKKILIYLIERYSNIVGYLQLNNLFIYFVVFQGS